MDDKYYSKYMKYKTKYLDLSIKCKSNKHSMHSLHSLHSQHGGGKHSCAVCKTQFPENEGKVVNTAIVIYSDMIPEKNNKRHVYMLLSQRNRWMTPGGNVDQTEEIALGTDHSKCWKALGREFSEEVGQFLHTIIPTGKIVPSHDIYDERTNTCTRLYYYDIGSDHGQLRFTTVPINGIGGKGFGEVKAAKWMELSSILDESVSNVAHYVVNSMKILRSKKLI